jgi:hypothetical protein
MWNEFFLWYERVCVNVWLSKGVCVCCIVFGRWWMRVLIVVQPCTPHTAASMNGVDGDKLAKLEVVMTRYVYKCVCIVLMCVRVF